MEKVSNFYVHKMTEKMLKHGARKRIMTGTNNIDYKRCSYISEKDAREKIADLFETFPKVKIGTFICSNTGEFGREITPAMYEASAFNVVAVFEIKAGEKIMGLGFDESIKKDQNFTNKIDEFLDGIGDSLLHGFDQYLSDSIVGLDFALTPILVIEPNKDTVILKGFSFAGLIDYYSQEKKEKAEAFLRYF